jgi:type IV pilus assembly protein PilA
MNSDLRSDRADRGFTLIELVIVVLVLGVILAIAIPTFLNATGGASSTAAKSNLYIVYRTENRNFVAGTGFLTTGAALQNLQPNVPMGYPQLSAKNTVYALTAPWSGFNDDSIAMAASDGTKCWYVYEGGAPEPPSTKAVPPGTSYSTGPAASNGYCIIATPPTGPPTSGSAAKGTPLTWYSSF